MTGGDSHGTGTDRGAATAATCDGSSECAAVLHLHGCYSDDGTNCDHPSEHSDAAKIDEGRVGGMPTRTLGDDPTQPNPGSSPGRPSSAASMTREPGWAVIHSYTGNVVAEYDTRQEAEDAVEWFRKTWPSGPSVEFCRAS